MVRTDTLDLTNTYTTKYWQESLQPHGGENFAEALLREPRQGTFGSYLYIQTVSVFEATVA